MGGGPGLTRGHGTPGFRVFVGLDWTQPGERAPARGVPAPVALPEDAGIAPERLVSVGYGETQPVDTNTTEAGRENNRRVEFNIEKLAGGDTGPVP